MYKGYTYLLYWKKIRLAYQTTAYFQRELKKLTQELREKINKENLNKKLSQRASLGWDKVNEDIPKAPFCEHHQQIVNLLFCGKCRYCKWNGLCHKCSKNGDEHFLGYLYYKNDYDDIFNVPYNYFGNKKYYEETINQCIDISH